MMITMMRRRRRRPIWVRFQRLDLRKCLFRNLQWGSGSRDAKPKCPAQQGRYHQQTRVAHSDRASSSAPGGIVRIMPQLRAVSMAPCEVQNCAYTRRQFILAAYVQHPAAIHSCSGHSTQHVGVQSPLVNPATSAPMLRDERGRERRRAEAAQSSSTETSVTPTRPLCQ